MINKTTTGCSPCPYCEPNGECSWNRRCTHNLFYTYSNTSDEVIIMPEEYLDPNVEYIN